MATSKRIIIAYTLLAAIIVLLLVILIGFSSFFGAAGIQEEDLVEPAAGHGPVETPKPKGVLYIVIDDVGNSMKDLEPFLKLDIPMTFAVLPERTYTVKAAKALHAAGKEVILHQPMEPEGEQNPGEGAIYAGMEADEVSRILEDHIRENPYAVGMNNHMGSKATADRKVMEAVLGFAKEKNLYYLDSYTTGSSVGKAVADTVKLDFAWRNSMFLDNDRSRESILEALRTGMEIAEKRGHAVMIGHVMSNELAELLLEMYPELLEEGYSFREVSDLFMENMTDAGSGD